MMKLYHRYVILVVLQVLLLQGCSFNGDEDKCRPPMFSLGAVLSDVRNKNYTDDVAIEFGVKSNSSVTEVSNIVITVYCPKEVTIGSKIAYDAKNENLLVVNNTVTWNAKSVAKYKGRNVGIPIRIKDGRLSRPIIIEAKLDYRQLSGCPGEGMESGTYITKAELTERGTKFNEWELVGR